MRHLTTTLTILATLCLATPALAQSLDQAIALEDQGLLVDALDAFEELLDAEGHSRDDLETIFSHLSVLRFASGDAVGARDAVMRLLAISPEARLPDSAPPELSEVRDEAVALWAGRRLEGRVEAADENGELTLRVRAVNDLAEMVAGAELLADSDVVDSDDGPGPDYVLNISSSQAHQAQLEVALISDRGSHLWSEEVSVAPVRRQGRDREPEDRPPPISRPRPRPRWHRIVAGAMLGVGLASVVGGGVALGVDNTPTGEERIEADTLYREFRTTASGGGVLVGLGGAVAVGGLVWLIMSRRRAGADDREEREDDEHLRQ